MIPADYQSQCDFYRNFLADLAESKLALPIPTGSINQPQSTTEGQEKIFTRSKFDTGTGDRRNEDELGSLDTV